MIALDTSALSLLFVPNALANTKTGKPIKHAQARMEHLIEKVSQEDEGRWGMSVKSVSQLALPPSHIPPPLLAKLEEEDDEIKTEPASPEVLGGGDGHPQGE